MSGQVWTGKYERSNDDFFGQLDLPIANYVNNDMRAEWVMVTPEIAEKLLGINYEKQRNVNRSRVAVYARDMKSGNWNPNSCTSIRVSSDGKVIDGQHRLLAVIESGVTVLMKIEYGGGTAAELFKFIDNTLARSAGQFIGAKNPQNVAALSKSILCLMQGATLTAALSGRIRTVKIDGSSVTLMPTRFEITDYANDNMDVLEKYASDAKMMNRMSGANPLAMSLAMFCIQELKGAYMLDEYVDEFREVAPENRTAAFVQATILRKVSQAKSQHVGVDKKWMFGVFMYGYDNFVAGRTIKSANQWKNAFSAYDNLICERFSHVEGTDNAD